MKFATGQYALALCDRCGQQYDYVSLRKEWNGLRVCPECFEQKHPQLDPKPVPFEPEALWHPRPDRKEPVEISVGHNIFPLFTDTSIQAISSVGKVSTTVSDSTPTAYVTGLAATSFVGSISTPDSASLTGLAATSSVGSVSITTPSSVTATYTVTVASYLGANYFYIDGVRAATLNLSEGNTYKFDQSDSSNSNHPLRFSTTSNGTHAGGSPYTTGVTTNGTPGSSGAYSQIEVASGAPTLYYYCTNHSGMGGTINT